MTRFLIVSDSRRAYYKGDGEWTEDITKASVYTAAPELPEPNSRILELDSMILAMIYKRKMNKQ